MLSLADEGFVQGVEFARDYGYNISKEDSKEYDRLIKLIGAKEDDKD